MSEAQFSRATRSATIIVVDDIGIVRRATARMLSEEGFRVFEAGSAVEALEVLRTAHHAVDLILADVVMPDVSGVDLVRLVRTQWPAASILFMSAYPAEILVREGLESPNVLFLAKPFTRDELLAKVGEALRGQKKQNGHESSRRQRD